MQAAMKYVFTIILLGFTTLAQANPDIEHWTGANGTRVYYVHAPELPMVDIRVVFDAGSARDGEQYGIGLMTNGMLAEGAAGMDADAIAEAFDDVGASFSNGSYRDMSVFSLRSLTKPALLDKAVATFTKFLNEPDFPKKSFKRLRKQMLIGLQAQQQSPRALTSKRFYEKLYGDHPYAHQSTGDEQSIKALSIAALKQHYQRYFVANNAIIAIVGDVDREQAEALAEQVLGKRPAGERAPALQAVKADIEGGHEHIDFPSQQTHVMIGQPVISRGDPDYFPLYVGNHILGGNSMVSRIFEEVREKRGLSYSAYSYMSPMRDKGPFVMSLQTKNETREEAIEVLQNTLQAFIDQGPSEEELAFAKNNITGNFALDIDSNADILGYTASIAFYDLPLDYLDSLLDKVEAVSVEQIRDAFQRRLQPEKMVIITTGEKS